MFIGVTVVDGVTQIGKTNYNVRLIEIATTINIQLKTHT